MLSQFGGGLALDSSFELPLYVCVNRLGIIYGRRKHAQGRPTIETRRTDMGKAIEGHGGIILPIKSEATRLTRESGKVNCESVRNMGRLEFYMYWVRRTV